MQEPIQAQATRSFGDYIQGVWYTLDPQDGQIMSLLGAGYFSTEGNSNLTHDIVDYRAGTVEYARNLGNHGSMAKQEHINPDEGYQPDYSKIEVPEKMTGTKRATTADDEAEAGRDEESGGEVRTEQAGNSSRRSGSRSTSRKQGGSGDN